MSLPDISMSRERLEELLARRRGRAGLGGAARRADPQRDTAAVRQDWGGSNTVNAYVVELPTYRP